MKRTSDQIICDITDALTQASGEFIEAIANAVLAKKVKFIGRGERSTSELAGMKWKIPPEVVDVFRVGGKKPCINDRVLSHWKCPKCHATLKDGQTFIQIAEVGNPICDCDETTEMDLYGIEIDGQLTQCN